MYYYMHMSEKFGLAHPEEFTSLPTAYYFDVLGGQLLVGQAAYDEHIISGGNPADCYELAFLLTNDVRLNCVPEHVRRNNRNTTVTEDELIDLGVWLKEVVRAEPYNGRLAVSVMTRAYQLGLLTAGRKKILNSGYFGNMGHFLQAVGVEKAVYRGKYDGWSFIDCAEYVKSYSAELEALGVKPREVEFIENANKAKGPSPDVMQKLTGLPICELLMLAGYVYARNWTDEDFIEWGVRFMMANEGKVPSMTNIVTLSAIRRGPGMATLTRRYGFENFQARVNERYQGAIEELRIEHDALKRDETYGPIIKDQPDTVRSHLRSLRMVARCQLLEAAGLNLPEDAIQTLIFLNDSKLFISAVARRLPDADPDEVAVALRASALAEIYLKAFPLNDFMTNLKVL